MKKSAKGRHEWENACDKKGLWPWKLKALVKTRFAIKVIMFEEILEFKDAIF
jgi:hypothetical protein